jgi:GT2 family glycosyltransferase
VAEVAVVIPNRDGAGVLERCLDALALARGIGEIVVVDDGSTDGSPEAAARRDGVRVLTSPGRGFSAAVNHGVAATATELFLLLNSDAFVRPDAVERLAEAVGSRPGLAICGAGLVHEDGRRSKSCDRELTLGRALREAAMLHYPPLTEQPGLQPVQFLPLACALTRRRAWDDAGGLDERYRFYYEDHDLCWRLLRAGWELAVFWEAEAVHVGGASSVARHPSEWFGRYHESRIRYLRRRYPRGSYVYSAAWLVNALVHAGLWTVRAAVQRDRSRLGWAAAYLNAALPPDEAGP